jgi:hypothetical protein
VPKVVTKVRLEEQEEPTSTYRRKQTAFHGKRVGEQQTDGKTNSNGKLLALGTAFTGCGYAQGDGGRTEG